METVGVAVVGMGALAGAYDTAGEEERASGLYERAMAAGLAGDLLRRCLVQYGSTLRNLGELERSLAVFDEARAAFPDSPSLAAFQAITLHAAGRLDEAVGVLLDVVADHVTTPDIARYAPALHGNAAYIRDRATGR